MDPKPNAMSEKLVIACACASALFFEAALALIVRRRWLTLSGLSRFWLVYLGLSFAMLWYCQLRAKGKIACLVWTCSASVGALWAIIGPR